MLLYCSSKLPEERVGGNLDARIPEDWQSFVQARCVSDGPDQESGDRVV